MSTGPCLAQQQASAQADLEVGKLHARSEITRRIQDLRGYAARRSFWRTFPSPPYSFSRL